MSDVQQPNLPEQKVRDAGKMRRARGLGFSILEVLVVLGILYMVNLVAWLNPKDFDLTKEDLFSLSSQTVQVVENLPEPVEAVVFVRMEETWIVELLQQYARANPGQFKVRTVDADREPGEVRKYGIRKYNTVVLEAGENKVKVEPATEASLTAALIQISRDEKKSVCFLTGHGEGQLTSGEGNGLGVLNAALTGMNYNARSVSLLESQQSIQGCAVVVIAGAEREPAPGEFETLQAYFEQGGGLLVLLDAAPSPTLAPLVEKWGIAAGNELVLDTSSAGRMLGMGPEVTLAGEYNTAHDITRDFNIRTFYPLSRPLRLDTAKAPQGYALDGIVRTGLDAELQSPTGARAPHGAITLAAALGPKDKEGERKGRVVVFGNSQFIQNRYFDALGNGDLFLNTVNWLAGEQELIGIRPKKPENKRLQITDTRAKWVFYTSVALLPGLALLLGGFVLIRRYR